ASRARKTLPRRSIASTGSPQSRPPPAHRSHRRDVSSSAAPPAIASAIPAAPSAPRKARRTLVQRTANRSPRPTHTADDCGPTANSVVTDKDLLALAPDCTLLVSYFASFLHLNSQSLQILTYMFHPVAQYLPLRFHLIRHDYLAQFHFHNFCGKPCEDRGASCYKSVYEESFPAKCT